MARKLPTWLPARVLTLTPFNHVQWYLWLVTLPFILVILSACGEQRGQQETRSQPVQTAGVEATSTPEAAPETPLTTETAATPDVGQTAQATATTAAQGGETPEAAETPPLEGRGAAGALNIEISAPGNQLAFTRKEIRVPANATVQLQFKNDASGLQHNWVLVDGDKAVADQVAQMATGAPDYIPEDNQQIIAHTNTINGGETDSVTFTTPPPGEYIYLCTVPGHYQGGMWGILVVESDG